MMLAGNDMVNLEGDGRSGLGQAAVFTSPGSTVADRICGRPAAMPLVDRPVRLKRAAGLRVHQVEQETDAAVVFHFRLLHG